MQVIQEIINDMKPASRKDLSENYQNIFATTLSEDKLLKIFTQIINSDERVAMMTNYSFYHPLGFYHIPIVERLNGAMNLILHVYDKKAFPLPFTMIEGKHLHPWDLTAKVLYGEVENHVYALDNIGDEDLALFEKVQEQLKDLEFENVQDIEKKLSFVQMSQDVSSHTSLRSCLQESFGGITHIHNELQQRLHCSASEIDILCRLYSSFSSRYDLESQSLRLEHLEQRKLVFKETLKYREGDIYFHAQQKPHMAFSNAKQETAVLMLTGHPVQAGVFYRHSGVYRRDLENVKQVMINESDVRNCLTKLLTKLQNSSESAGRQHV